MGTVLRIVKMLNKLQNYQNKRNCKYREDKNKKNGFENITKGDLKKKIKE